MRSIFPTLRDRSSTTVNLNDEAIDWRRRHPEIIAAQSSNPLLVPSICQNMVDAMHRRLGVDWSHGGYLEDRSTLWEGSYLQPDRKFFHLGIDCNVPPATPVCASRKMEVVRIDDDREENGGWGPRVIAQPKEGDESCLLLFAHLHRDLRCKVGDVLRPQQVFCEVGTPPTNGNWFPHLHVQAVTLAQFDALLKEDRTLLTNLDGYCTADEFSTARERYPDPSLHV